MTYTPTKWVNGGKPAISAENLNKIEEELARLSIPDITETTSTTQPNSYAGREHILEIGGVTEQDSTAGNQLCESFPASSATDIYNNALVIKADFKPNTQYTFSFKGAVGNRYYINENMFVDDISFTIVDGINTFTATTKDADFSSQWVGNSGYLILKNHKNQTSQNKFEEVMVNLGSTALPYEKFSGGQPAPNPSYPQEIKKSAVSGVKTHRKNFLKNTATTQTINGGTFTINEDKSVTVNGTFTATTAFAIANQGTYIATNDSTYMLSGCPANGSDNSYYIHYQEWDSAWGDLISVTDYGNGVLMKHNDNAVYSRMVIGIAKDVTCNNLTFKPMIREVGTDATYEPYTESAITFSQPIELYGIEDVQDVIEDGKVKRRIGNVKLSGEWAWNKHASVGSIPNANGYYSHQSIGQPKVLDGSNGILTHFTRGNLTLANYNAFVGSDAVQLRFDEITNAEELKAWLNANEVYAYYILANETTEPLPIADQIALNSLQTYDGITYVEFDSEIQPTFKAEYGTSKVGGYTLEGLLAGRNGELKN